MIISPSFPPLNSADMHRVRQSLPYLKRMGWNPVVISVDPKYAGGYSTDDYLMSTLPADMEVHRVKAWPEKITRRLGLGSLGIRSAWFIYRMGCRLMRKRQFDLVYFSTTAFHVMALGPKWKKKFGIPFVLDIQDPWRNDFYLSKPPGERPPKFLLSYRIDKYLEAYTLPKADGIISVSQAYCDCFMQRYPTITPERFRVIPFGAAVSDLVMLDQIADIRSRVLLDPRYINMVYAGRGGHDLRFALEIIFGAFCIGLQKRPELFDKIRCTFAGTSYAGPGQGTKTITPVADKFGLTDRITELTDRLPYFETLRLLRAADILLVPGSTDTAYTASKIYPYVMMQKPLLAVFHEKSSVVSFMQDNEFGQVLPFDHVGKSPSYYVGIFLNSWIHVLECGQKKSEMDKLAPYTAERRTKEQVDFFEEILKRIS